MLATAQNTFKAGKLTGTVSGNSKIIESANVSLLKAKDSSVVKMAITDKAGKFEIEKISEGKYLVAVQNVGYAKYFSDAFEISATKNTKALAIDLKVASKELSEVTVTASKKPLVEQKIDRMIVNVEASITNVGATALEVLEKSPGITVDKDGNISLKGKQGVMVLIDGRQTYLSGEDLANLLRNMNAAQLDQIEIMTNPPAKYDAAGNSGIINIKTKKTKIKGFNGSVNVGYGQGVYPKTNESINLNYRTGKINLFGNYSFNYREDYQQLDISRNFMDSTTKQISSIFKQQAVMNKMNRSHNAKIGMDYFVSKKTTVGFVVTGFDNTGTVITNTPTNIFDKNNVLQSVTKTNSDGNSEWKNLSTNVNLRQLLDTSGQELTVDLDYSGYNAGSYQRLASNYFNAAGIPTQRGDTLDGNLPSIIKIYTAKADYTLPLKHGAKFEAGVKTSFVKTDNNAIYDSLINAAYVPDYTRSNHFIYKENINAAYVNYSKELSKKWSAQLGLRLENTHSQGNQLGNVQQAASSFDTSYTQLFPTAYISYKLNDKNQFVINYGRRIDRPNYQDLNPFIQFIDKYTFQQGNPSLRPQFSDNIELSHMYLGGAITTTLNYTHVSNIIQEAIEQNSATNQTFIKKSNIATLNQFGIAVNLYLPVKKWWTINFYTNVFNNHYSGLVNNTYVDIDGTSVMFNGSFAFKFNKGWGAEINGFYRGKAVQGVLVSEPMGSINFGFSKSVLKENRGTIRLNFRDPFRLQYFRGASKYGDVDASFTNHWDNRVINIGFTYRFSKGKVNTPQRKRSSVDEKNRVNAGDN